MPIIQVLFNILFPITQETVPYYSRDSPLLKIKQQKQKKTSDDITVWLTNMARDK